MTEPQRANAAAELLALEKKYRTGAFDDLESDRWQELVSEISGADRTENARRSFRLASAISATVRIREGRFPCTISDISRIGLMAAGAAFRYITHEDTIEVLSVQVGTDQPLNLVCNIARLDSAREPPIAALSIASENTAETRGRFFDYVYYPLYLEYLAGLAKGAAPLKSAKPEKATKPAAKAKKPAPRASGKAKKATKKPARR